MDNASGRPTLLIRFAVVLFLAAAQLVGCESQPESVTRAADETTTPARNSDGPTDGDEDSPGVVDVVNVSAATVPGATEESGGPPHTITNSIGMQLTLVPAGEFQMGSLPSPEELAQQYKSFNAGIQSDFFQDEHPRHRVRITRPFFLGIHEVTVDQFRQFAAAGYITEPERDGEGGFGWNEAEGEFEGRDPKYTWRNTGWPQTDEHPVLNVTWNDAQAFVEWLSLREDRRYRLPTEAEWEYACRAGTETQYHHGDDPEGLAEVANVKDATAGDKFTDWKPISARDGYAFTAPVGKFSPNAFGLYDMHGNVWEWCQDWYGDDYFSKSPVDDPPGPATGSFRVVRGGSWYVHPYAVRSANRINRPPAQRRNFYSGFRVALDPK